MYKSTLCVTFSIEELEQKLALRTWFYQTFHCFVIIKGGREDIFGVSHDVDDLQ